MAILGVFVLESIYDHRQGLFSQLSAWTWTSMKSTVSHFICIRVKTMPFYTSKMYPALNQQIPGGCILHHDKTIEAQRSNPILQILLQKST